MKLSMPRHVPIDRLVPVLGAVLALQLLEGTNIFTALEFSGFLLLMTAAFNAVGGMVYPSGAYIVFFTLLTAGLGGLAKLVLGEPLDSNVFNAQKTMLVYLVGAASILGAAEVARRVRATKPWLYKLRLDSRAPQVGLGAALLGQFGGIVIPMSVMSTFNQLNNFLPLSVLVLVYARTRQTNGWKSFSILGFAAWAWITVAWGILAFSKQGMYSPSAIWIIAALLAGYHCSIKKLVAVLIAAGLAATFLTPVSQVGRNYRFQANSNAIAWDLLTHPMETRRTYLAAQAEAQSSANAYHWFSEPQGLLDRLTMFPIDDALIHITDQGHVMGLLPIETYAINVIPRYFMSSEKIVWHWGNRYAHELGMLGPKDDSTGVSFSPLSDGYHCVKWWGVTVVTFLILSVMFTFCDSLTGSTDQTFWGAIYMILFTHAASEGMLNAPFAAVSTYAVGVVFTAVLGRTLLPYIGNFFYPAPRSATYEVTVAPAPDASARPSFARTIEESL